MVLRWLAAPLVLTLPSAPQSPQGLPAPLAPLLPPAELRVKPPQRFDRSLEALERNQIITPQERRTLERGAVAKPIDMQRNPKFSSGIIFLSANKTFVLVKLRLRLLA